MSLRILILAALASSAMATSYNKCGKGDPPVELRVLGCEEQPCIIKRGGDVNATVDFRPSKNVKNLQAKVRATAFGVTVNYTLPQPDACKELIDSACPLESGDLATYKLGMHLTEIIPEASVVVELRLVNPDGQGADGSEDVIVCFSIQIEVVNNINIKII